MLPLLGIGGAASGWLYAGSTITGTVLVTDGGVGSAPDAQPVSAKEAAITARIFRGISVRLCLQGFRIGPSRSFHRCPALLTVRQRDGIGLGIIDGHAVCPRRLIGQRGDILRRLGLDLSDLHSPGLSPDMMAVEERPDDQRNAERPLDLRQIRDHA